jgi:hypothetical protein
MSKIKADDIVYLRARVCSTVNETTAGRECVLIEPVDKSAKIVQGAWIFTVPVEWLTTLEEMRKAARR